METKEYFIVDLDKEQSQKFADFLQYQKVEHAFGQGWDHFSGVVSNVFNTKIIVEPLDLETLEGLRLYFEDEEVCDRFEEIFPPDDK